MKHISTNSEEHDKELLKLEARFFAILQRSEQLKYLCDMVIDPKAIRKGYKIRNFYFICRGEKSLEKHTIINYAMIYFSDMLVMKGFKPVPMSKIKKQEDVSNVLLSLFYFHTKSSFHWCLCVFSSFLGKKALSTKFMYEIREVSFLHLSTGTKWYSLF